MTALIIPQFSNAEKGWLDVEHIEKFPCEDLRTIDQLWIKYSNGRFGFSVQKRIYQSLGGTREYDDKVWDKFGDRVGWRKKNAWLYYNDLTFSEKAPEAHLPCLLGYGVEGGGYEGVVAESVGFVNVADEWWVSVGSLLSLLSRPDF